MAVDGAMKKTMLAKTKKARPKPTHPKTADMVDAAIEALKERRGSSLQAIKKYMAGTYKIDIEHQAPFIKKYLKAAIFSGALIRTRGKGAAGSFRLSSLKVNTLKPKAKLSVKTATPKKNTASKKPFAQKSFTRKTSATFKIEKKTVSKGSVSKTPKSKTIKSKPPTKKAKRTPAKMKKRVAGKPINVAPKRATPAKK